MRKSKGKGPKAERRSAKFFPRFRVVDTKALPVPFTFALPLTYHTLFLKVAPAFSLEVLLLFSPEGRFKASPWKEKPPQKSVTKKCHRRWSPNLVDWVT